MTPIELLEETARRLRAQGWGRKNDPGCLLSRMYQVAGLRFGHAVEREHATLRVAAMAVRRHLGVQHLTMWNDEPGRTLDQVFAAIDGAKALLARPSPPS